MDRDETFMARALELARLGAGHTSPNPMVGALVVSDGQVVGEGYHRQAGTPHAEVHALNAAGRAAAGATLYVSLEPCDHHGRTPPCTEAILVAGIRRVVVAVRDPNPRVAGRGSARLREAGIEVTEGVLEAEAARLNEAFFHYMTRGRPFLTMKYAMTLDGRIATATGDSRWVSGAGSRAMAHRLRSEHDAVMVGIGTVLRDDPLLTARPPDGNGRDPIRIILDSRLSLPATARVLRADSPAPTWVVATPLAPADRRQVIEEAARESPAPLEVITVPAAAGRVDLRALFQELGRRGLTSVLLEGGATVNAAALAAGLVQKIVCFVAPKLFGGGIAAPGPVAGQGVATPAEARYLKRVHVESIGDDAMITGYLDAEEGDADVQRHS